MNDPNDTNPTNTADVNSDVQVKHHMKNRRMRTRRIIRLSSVHRKSRHSSFYRVNIVAQKPIEIETKPFKCTIPGCTYAGTKKQYLSNHMTRTHSTEKWFSCKICSKRFNKQKQLDEHNHEHDEKTMSPCATCRKVFDTENEKKQHEKTCKQRLPCKYCSKMFAKPHTLRAHLAVHENSSK